MHQIPKESETTDLHTVGEDKNWKEARNILPSLQKLKY